MGLFFHCESRKIPGLRRAAARAPRAATPSRYLSGLPFLFEPRYEVPLLGNVLDAPSNIFLRLVQLPFQLLPVHVRAYYETLSEPKWP